MSWHQTADGISVHNEGWRLSHAELRDGRMTIGLLGPNNEVLTEFVRDGRGRWQHARLPESHDGGFATVQAAASDLLDRVFARGVHAGTDGQQTAEAATV